MMNSPSFFLEHREELEKEYFLLKRQRESNEDKDLYSEDIFTSEMCPKCEFMERMINNDYHARYEKKFLIKKFQRSTAGKLEERPEDIRNISTLQSCLQYLLSIDLDSPSTYKFIDNRIRAIKLDF